MGSCACLQHHRARWLCRKETNYFAPVQLALYLNLFGLINAMHLERGLGGVEADHGNAHNWRLPFCRSLTTRTLAR
jgi:hypothetical protein